MLHYVKKCDEVHQHTIIDAGQCDSYMRKPSLSLVNLADVSGSTPITSKLFTSAFSISPEPDPTSSNFTLAPNGFREVIAAILRTTSSFGPSSESPYLAA